MRKIILTILLLLFMLLALLQNLRPCPGTAERDSETAAETAGPGEEKAKQHKETYKPAAGDTKCRGIE